VNAARTNRIQPPPDVQTGVRLAVRLPVAFGSEQAERIPVRPAVQKFCSQIGIQFPGIFAHNRRVRFLWMLLLVWAWAVFPASAQTNQSTAPGVGSSPLSHLIEATGVVEFNLNATTNWNIATNGLALKPGDKVRTRAASRAALQLSDRSVVRLSERTTLEILPPRNAEKRRFGLPDGKIYFFNREKPSDVEFDTPLAAGAIRGTEFLLETKAEDGATHLALLDGLVVLNTASGEVNLKRGEEVRLAAGQPPQKTALVNATAIIQWALYYSAVLHPADLGLTPTERQSLAGVLTNYLAGDLLKARAMWPTEFSSTNVGAICLQAQLSLAVGLVEEAIAMLAPLPKDASPVLALHELIATVRGGTNFVAAPPLTASEFISRSYSAQAHRDLEAARAAGRRAVELAPELGVAHARLAELEFAFGQRAAALHELQRAYELSPRFPPAYALQGFILLEQGKSQLAKTHFDAARDLDAAFGPAWLGRGLCLMRERDFGAAREAFQAAAALEPQRGLFRSYLGKAASELRDSKAAEKEFRLAKELDPNDPTAWLYSALHLWQENRLNDAIRDLENSSDRNDNRAAFRSQLLLDQDRAVRSANLAALYEEAGLPDASRQTATRAVNESYADFSGHLFRANALAAQENANRFDLRNETARQSELLVANLLAPPGAGNLSQTLSQQEHLRFFDTRPIGASLLSEYTSNGDWRETGTMFGSLDGFSYAFDAIYQNLNGEQPNGQSERRGFALTLKQRVTSSDEAYFQLGTSHSRAGDVANYYNPAQSQLGFWAHERQEPTLYAGWHHEWSPGVHTLFLYGRLEDSLTFHDPNANAIFLRQSGGVTVEVQSPPAGPAIEQDFGSDFALDSFELQQLWETERVSLIVGGRWQQAEVEARSDLTRVFPLLSDAVNESFERANAYSYFLLKVVEPLRVVAGASYDRLEFPRNADVSPLSAGETSRDLVAPKVGLLFTPWERGLFRASYTKSLGGLYFDNSVRLEPTQVGGFNQAFRSLIPESVVGLVPGTEFETAGVGFDQSLASGTWFGVEAEWLTSEGDRDIGVLTNSTFLPIPDSPGRTREQLRFRERNASAYLGQLLGESFSVGARYRLSEAKLAERFPDIPDTAANLSLLESNERAVLQELSLTANFHHRRGFFGQWESAWYHQHNFGYTPTLNAEDLWQHNFVVGYRFPRRQVVLTFGLLNVFDADYRLNPLNLTAALPRGRTFTVSLRLSF
jgi:Flp pilus assembly protein TadD